MEQTINATPHVVPAGRGRVIELPGASIEFKRPPQADPTVAVMAATPDFPGPFPHIHRTHHELFYVVDGTFDFFVGGDAMRVEAGAFLDVPPGVVHDFRNPGPSVAQLLAIAQPGDLQGYFEAVEEMLLAGSFTLEKLEALRLRYDTEEVHIDWVVRQDR